MGNLVFQATLGGQVNLVGPNTASTYNINVPAVAGNMVTTGDTGTVTNTMLANSSVTIGSTGVALGATASTVAGLTLTSPTLTTPALGTPASGILTNCTGLPASTGITGVVAEANGGTGTTTGYYGFKNRIINGAMMIDQRNAGASVAGGTSGTYTLDRWRTINNSGSSRFNIKQTTVTSLSGFSNYMAVTSTGSYPLGASEVCAITQSIEGFNTADLNFGTVNAKTITLSFWVQSSLTGTFSGSIGNGAADRSYPFTYTISSANTWEQKSVTITGDTSGTWIGATNGIGMRVAFCLGGGASALGTSGVWGSFFNGATGTTSVVGTNEATFYITGVQLEKGSTATSFDYRPYGTELALCQRYFYRMQNDGSNTAFMSCAGESTTTMAGGGGSFPVAMRTIPTPTLGAGVRYYSASSGNITPTINANRCSSTTFSLLLNGTSITAGQGGAMYNSTTNGYVDLSAEL